MSDLTLASMLIDYLIYFVFFVLGVWVGRN